VFAVAFARQIDVDLAGFGSTADDHPSARRQSQGVLATVG
jgi:hypothetical protein